MTITHYQRNMLLAIVPGSPCLLCCFPKHYDDKLSPGIIAERHVLDTLLAACSSVFDVSAVCCGLSVTNCTQQSAAAETDSSTACHECPQTVYSTVQRSVHNNTPLAPLTCQMKPLHEFLFYSYRMYFNIILPYCPKSSNCSLCFRFSHQINSYISLIPHVCHVS